MTAVKDSPAVDLGDLVQAHQADLWRYLRYLGCEPSEADDLVQETFLALVRKPPELRDPDAMAGYLRTAARNQLLMLRRRQGRDLATADLELAENVWAEANAESRWSEWLDALHDCLKTAVTERTRKAIDMFYRERIGRAEIARQLGMAADGVKTLLRRARSALRTCVERKLREP
ncbi:MAG: sigma-70 family RNA polymerase sigma factor [Pirellulales bacterium]|nr:sigma-70 family RNA polymerase sigma factor [Pirellulales bacterium]